MEIIKNFVPSFLKIEGIKIDGQKIIFERINKKAATAMLLFDWNYKKIILVKQYRVALLEEMWEIPAGILEDHLTPIENMLKEIEEETGYKREDILDMEEIYCGYPSTGYTNEKIHIFLGRIRKGATPKKLSLDEGELISEVGFFSFDEAQELGAFKCMKTALAVNIYQNRHRKKIGILGGTFDPITFLHLRTAERAIEDIGLDELYFEPVNEKYNDALKKNLSSSFHRANMIKLALEENENPKMKLGTYEIEQPFPVPTIETLNYYKDKFGNAEIYFICGSDNLKKMSTWQNSDELLGNFNIICLQRNNDEVYKNIIFEDEKLFKYRKNIKVIYEIVENDLSSSKVRNAIKNNMSISCMLPYKVRKYIEENNLYVKK